MMGDVTRIAWVCEGKTLIGYGNRIIGTIFRMLFHEREVMKLYK